MIRNNVSKFPDKVPGTLSGTKETLRKNLIERKYREVKERILEEMLFEIHSKRSWASIDLVLRNPFQAEKNDKMKI